MKHDHACDCPATRRSFIGRIGFGVFGGLVTSLVAGVGNHVEASSVREVAPGLRIWPRSSWGAKLPPIAQLTSEADVKFLLVHHTAASSSYRQADVTRQIQSIYRFHTESKRWPDVCYNFFVDRFGGVWEGRQGSLDNPIQADATGGNQGFAQLVCLLGNFEKDQPSAAMMDSCARVLGWLAKRHGIKLDQSQTVSFVSRGSNRWKRGVTVKARPISGHRDMSATLCPGRFVYSQLEESVPAAARKYLESLDAIRDTARRRSD